MILARWTALAAIFISAVPILLGWRPAHGADAPAVGPMVVEFAWRKLNTIDLDDIYDSYPSNEYYEKRLGKR